MTIAELVLAVVNVGQVCFLAWIASRQQQVKHDLQQVNGEVTIRLDEIREALAEPVRVPRAPFTHK